jgi:positive regulator of sigma E activity
VLSLVLVKIKLYFCPLIILLDMSIIQNIRERGTWIILGLITIALIAFILQDGVGQKQRAADSNTLGEVNGQIIKNWNNKYNNMLIKE